MFMRWNLKTHTKTGFSKRAYLYAHSKTVKNERKKVWKITRVVILKAN